MSITVNAGPAPSRATVLGLILLAPAVAFLLVAILEKGFGLTFFSDFMAVPQQREVFNVVSPILFFGGLAAALLLNALAIAEFDVRWDDRRLLTKLAIEPRMPSMALIVTTSLLLALFIGYFFVENYRIVETHG